MNIRKLRVGEVFSAARHRDAGILVLNEIDNAAWLWHPQAALGERAFVCFRNEFRTLESEPLLRLQVTGDQHYELFLDGERISSGPDMGNPDHWFFSCYEIELPAGEHRLEARVWWLGDDAPASAMTFRGGFALAAGGEYDTLLTTGKGDWRVCRLEGLTVLPGGLRGNYHDIGGRQEIDGAALARSGDWQTPAVVHPGLNGGNAYPLHDEAEFHADGADFGGIRKIAVRALQMCAHTTYMDCPYYEQMMYVGDTRIEALTTYMLTRDAALPRRAMELFDYSRSHWGVACERYPARCWQNSLTFAMIWTWMVHDYCFWRGDLPWVCERLVGVRANLDVIGQYAGADGLLRDLPGWSFMDWVKEWPVGRAPGTLGGISSLINLMYLLSLQKTAELEELAGEPLRAQLWRQKAAALSPAIVARFWDERRGLLADEEKHVSFSEHAQCLAILAGLLQPEQQERALQGLLKDKDLHRTTIYFRYYYFDALCKAGRTDVVLQGFAEWYDLLENGLMTTREAPEPTRSDCHAWGTHPLFFLVAGFLGLRPLEPGMRRVRIAPQPAGLPELRGRVPHPQGELAFDLRFADGRCSGWITLPGQTEGVFVWNGTETAFTGTLRF